MESELDDSKNQGTEIQHDFEKLLSVKAPFKLMIYSSRLGNADAILENIMLSIVNYGHHLLGETYMFIDYSENNPEKIHGSFIASIWQPKSSGRQDPAVLIPVA